MPITEDGKERELMGTINIKLEKFILLIEEIGFIGLPKHKLVIDLELQSEDGPVVLQACEKFGLILVVTKLGFLMLFEVLTGEKIFQE
jgi:hypothetical protein